MVEFVAQVFGDNGADEEVSGGHFALTTTLRVYDTLQRLPVLLRDDYSGH
jgi:hypothetical protein